MKHKIKFVKKIIPVGKDRYRHYLNRQMFRFLYKAGNLFFLTK